jgi:tRNA pseudouridine38-40 synthase
VSALSVTQNENEISLNITADGFLYNMVRVIAAQAVKAGKGQIPPERVPLNLNSGLRANARECAPACGLYFVKAEYAGF